MIHACKYTAKQFDEWNSFVNTAKNGTFLLKRTYMDYHKDKFPDLSFMFFKRNSLCGIIPITINRSERTASSHAGLTYGGLLVQPKTEYEMTREMLEMTFRMLRAEGIEQFYYKPVPHIYHKYPSEEDLYYLYANGAQLSNRSLSAVIDLQNSIAYSTLRQRKLRKSRHQAPLEICECTLPEDRDQWHKYWLLLSEVLNSRHQARPVHDFEEILYLKRQNTYNIKLYVALCKSTKAILAGVVVYCTDTTVHCQYIAVSDEGRSVSALDVLFDWLITRARANYRYFDFGTSNEQGGLFLNAGLLFQKEGFGARAICYDTYRCIL